MPLMIYRNNLEITCCLLFFSTPTPYILQRFKCRFDKILVGTEAKVNVGELEEEARERFTRRLRKDFTKMVGRVDGKKRSLMRFQYGFKKGPR